LINDVRPRAHQLVDDPGNALFVAGDGRGGENDHVACANLQLSVLGKGHARKAAHRLALATGGKNGDLVVLIAVDLVHADEPPLGNAQIAQLHGGAGDVDHTAAHQADLAPKAHGRI